MYGKTCKIKTKNKDIFGDWNLFNLKKPKKNKIWQRRKRNQSHVQRKKIKFYVKY